MVSRRERNINIQATNLQDQIKSNFIMPYSTLGLVKVNALTLYPLLY